MNTLDIEIALIDHFGFLRNIIVPNVSWGMGRLNGKDLHECDLLVLSKSNYATEIEIKISNPDLIADTKKKHRHYHNHIARFYFAVPKKLTETALEIIPERAGLYAVKKEGVELIKRCVRNKNSVQWSEAERLKLAHLGTMRILGLKRKIAKIQKNRQIFY